MKHDPSDPRAAMVMAAVLIVLGGLAIALRPWEPDEEPLAAPLPPASVEDAGAGPIVTPLLGHNLVILMVDTLRADHLEPYGYARPTSPWLERFARETVLFERVVAPAPQTVPSVVSLFTGVYPHRHGNEFFHPTNSFRVPMHGAAPELRDDIPLLAEYLAGAGYRTVAGVGNPWMQPEFGFGRGFDAYTSSPIGTGHPRANALDELGLSALGEAASDPRPFFLYLHYMDVHSPYRPETYRDAFVGDLEGEDIYVNGLVPDARADDVAYTRALYDAEIREMDDHLRAMFDAIAQRGLAETTLFVIVSDHGEELYEHGGMGHGTTLYQELLHVPLLMRHPSLTPGRVEAQVSLVDLLPTFMRWLTGSVPPDLDGRSLHPLVEVHGMPRASPGERAAFDERILLSEVGHERAAIRGDHKVIATVRDPARAYYDLAADALEQRSIEPPPGWADPLRTTVEAIPPPPISGPGGQTIDPALRERLEALGYVVQEP